MRVFVTCIVGALVTSAGSPARAEVSASDNSGFVSHNEVLVAASPAEAWTAITRPGDWWNGDHTYSGDPANLTLAPTPGSCFCEVIPGADGRPTGHVEHMRVLYAAPGSTLRLSGGLGPLQSEAVTGVLTIALEPAGEMTKITWDYVVGGFARTSMSELAPAVDRVVGEQLHRLAARLGEQWDGVQRRF